MLSLQQTWVYVLPGVWPLACAANTILLQRRAQHSKDAVTAQESHTPPEDSHSCQLAPGATHAQPHTRAHSKGGGKPENTSRAGSPSGWPLPPTGSLEEHTVTQGLDTPSWVAAATRGGLEEHTVTQGPREAHSNRGAGNAKVTTETTAVTRSPS